MSTEGRTLDRFLGGRVTAAQPANGFRAGHDTVLLAAAIPADDHSIVLELGAGAGIASLCLAARVPGVRITGIEIDPDLVRIANENAVRNAVTDRVSFFCGDARASSNIPFPPPSTGEVARSDGGGAFDHVFFNPPFHPDTGHKSPSTTRDRATRDSHDAVREWTGRALALVRDGGTVTAIIRADRIDDILDIARGCRGVIFPLFPRTGVTPKRAIIHIVKSQDVSSHLSLPSSLEGEGGAKRRKGGDDSARSIRDPMRSGFVHATGLVLHEADGRNTEAVEAILRHGQALNLAP